MKTIIETLNEYRDLNNLHGESLAQTHIRLYGENSVFLMNKHEHGLYYDDYCGFKYWSNATGEFFEDTWSTSFSCPPYNEYIVMTFEEAMELDLVDMKIWNDNWEYNDKYFMISGNADPDFFIQTYDLCPEIKVFRGRKVQKGRTGYIVDQFIDEYQTRYFVCYDSMSQEKFFIINEDYCDVTLEYIQKINSGVKELIDKERNVTNQFRSFNPEQSIKIALYKESIGYDSYFYFVKKSAKEWLKKELEKQFEPTPKFMEWLKNHFPEKNEDELRQIGININKKNQLHKKQIK